VNDTYWYVVIFIGATVLAVPIYHFMQNWPGNVTSILRRMGAAAASSECASAQGLHGCAEVFELRNVPKLLVIDSPAANAFAVGGNTRTGALVVTTGLERLLDGAQLRAVLATLVVHLMESPRASTLTSGVEGADTSVRHAGEYAADGWAAAITEDPASHVGALRRLGSATTAIPDWQAPKSAFGDPSVWAYVSLVEGAQSLPRRLQRLQQKTSVGDSSGHSA
jgi:hypothetical protein